MVDLSLNTITNIDDSYDGYFKAICIPDSDFEKKVNIYLMTLSKNKSVIIDHRCTGIKTHDEYDESQDVDEDDNLCIYPKIPYNGINVDYKGYSILVKPILLEKKMNRIGNHHSEYSGMYYHLVIHIKNGDNDIINKLYHDSNIWFNQIFLDKNLQKNKIKLFIWDEWRWTILSRINKRSYDTVYLPDTQVDYILKSLNQFFSTTMRELYDKLNITYKKCYLFEGPPGTGKSTLIKAIGSSLNKNIAYLNITPEYTERDLFKTIRGIPKDSILVIEDIDSIFEKRDKTDHKNSLSFSGLLNALDGLIEPKKGQLIIMTTNYRNKLDGALKRPGRIDEIIQFDYCKRNEIEKLYNNFFPKETKFEKLYEKIKEIDNLTICFLQQYFLKYLYDVDNLYNNTKEISNIIDECNLYKDKNKYMYN